MIKKFFDFFKKPKRKKDNKVLSEKSNENKASKANVTELFNQINQNTDKLLMLGEPKIFSLSTESNILCKYKNSYILTKDGNLSIGVELKGASYSALTLEEEMSYLENRIAFFTKLHPQIEMNIIVKKNKFVNKNNIPLKSKNIYANEIISKWENSQNIYKIRYFLMISTTSKTLTGALESFKEKSTNDENKTKKNEINLKIKINILNETLGNIKSRLSIFKPRLMNNDEVLDFYATYANAKETKLKYTHEILTDSYISSDLEFKKSHFVFHTNEGKEIFARFLSVKAYESETIKSLISSNTLKNDNEFLIFIHITPFPKEKAIKKIRDSKVFAEQIIKEELDTLMEQIKADRENLIQVSFSVLLKDENEKKLEQKSEEVRIILENQNLNVVRESINQKALFFSFFPSRGNLNARKKTLKISNLATITTFENEVTGFNRNDWGEEAVTRFKHLNGTPFLFNFHFQEFGDKPNGHTLIIGGTGAGKTTLTQFLMTNLFKYDIDIFAMDKLRGMHNFTQYVGGEYHDSADENFKLNPFSLEYNSENIAFLELWLSAMGGIDDEDYKSKNEIASTLKRMYLSKKDNQIFSLENFIISLPYNNENDLKMRFERFKNSIFNNTEDALNFEKQLSILNMDSILNDPKIAGLTAMYIFHKLKIKAKNNDKKRGFFCFIDELKDYLNDETMSKKILEAILEVRKIGGVMCMGYQTISLFNNDSYGSTFLNNIANFIIFPTNNKKEIELLEELINLNPFEAKFLSSSSLDSRQILNKMRLRNESAYLDIDLSKLGVHLKCFSSSSDNTMLIKKLQKEYPNEWRTHYLRTDTRQDFEKEFIQNTTPKKEEAQEEIKDENQSNEEKDTQ